MQTPWSRWKLHTSHAELINKKQDVTIDCYVTNALAVGSSVPQSSLSGPLCSEWSDG